MEYGASELYRLAVIACLIPFVVILVIGFIAETHKVYLKITKQRVISEKRAKRMIYLLEEAGYTPKDLKTA